MFKTIRDIFIVILLIILLILLGKLILSSTTSPRPAVNLNQSSVVLQIKNLNRLETASFTIEKVIEAGTQGDSFKNILFGDKILLVAHAEIIAGIDLSILKETDVIQNNGTLTITLPPAQILFTRLDNAQTKVYDRTKGLLSRGQTDLESAARLQAEQSIRQAACQQNILGIATENAKNQLRTIFLTAGFTEVVIQTSTSTCL